MNAAPSRWSMSSGMYPRTSLWQSCCGCPLNSNRNSARDSLDSGSRVEEPPVRVGAPALFRSTVFLLKSSRETTLDGCSMKLATRRSNGSSTRLARRVNSRSALVSRGRYGDSVPAPPGSHSRHGAQPLHALPLDRGRTVPAPGPPWASCCRMATRRHRSLGRSAPYDDPLISAGSLDHACAVAEDAIETGGFDP